MQQACGAARERGSINQVTFSIADEILAALKTSPEAIASEIRFAASVKLYEMGRLSSGAAAQLAGVPKPYFLSRSADYGVNACDLSQAKIAHDCKNA